jgi:hypothetical protein
MGKLSVPTDVSLMLSKARAAVALAETCSHGSDYIQLPNDGQDHEHVLEWIRQIAFDTIRAALNEVEEIVHRPKAVA